ncbi:TPA: hypothetical protein N0F65_000412 [Lagenidium giganteum]|uniref:Uncharacterized protein n=1 Tax=Lagenidium giganteum TaxID=4803 RepID=A0AAV2Z1D7_9STRA|nr:TPA: hypothetical protein N0F65_000412 [Lagenidium giganteum]
MSTLRVPAVWVGPSIRSDIFDVVSVSIGVRFALLGVAIATVSCIVAPRQLTRVLHRTITTPAIAMVTIALSLVASHICQNEVAVQWRLHSLEGFDQTREAVFERKLNQLYCQARASHTCNHGTVADAQRLFHLKHWSNCSDRQLVSNDFR